MPKGVYQRHSRPVGERFWSKVEKGDGCWLWRGGMKPNGYGRFVIGHATRLYAHRVAWELTNGPVPDGLFVCHRCDNPRCVRPDHLFLGTHRDNMQDMGAKGRHFTPWKRDETCKRGHFYTPENTIVRTNKKGRECRRCANDSRNARRKRT